MLWAGELFRKNVFNYRHYDAKLLYVDTYLAIYTLRARSDLRMDVQGGGDFAFSGFLYLPYIFPY